MYVCIPDVTPRWPFARQEFNDDLLVFTASSFWFGVWVAARADLPCLGQAGREGRGGVGLLLGWSSTTRAGEPLPTY